MRLGAIAVWAGFVDEPTVEAAAGEQAARRGRGEQCPRLGEMLVARGRLTDAQVRAILRVQLQRLPDEGHLIFGQIARVSNLVTREDVRAALDEQSSDILAGGAVRRLGEILLAMGHIDEEAARAVLAFQATADGRPLAKATSARAIRPPESPAAPAKDVPPADSPPVAPPRASAFLPAGAAGFASDHVIWIAVAAAAALALVLIYGTDAIFG